MLFRSIKLMRETVGPDMGVKASGGVRTKEDALTMIENGATRIGAVSYTHLQILPIGCYLK